jgi:DNA/RNA non-specific endonuclease
VIATLANGHVTVPAATWKVALVIPKDGGDDISRVTCSSRTIAVIMPNTQNIRNDPWENYLTTVDAVEALTGYDLFAKVPQAFQACIEAGTNGNNPPLDTDPPAVTCASPDTTWHANNVSVACMASDTGSGLANPPDASFSLVTSVAGAAEAANASTNSHPVCDVAGNCATGGPIAGNMIDRKPPVVTVTTPSAGAVYQMTQIVNTAYGCQDGGSGVASCAGSTANGSPIDTSSPGIKTFVVTATDAVGNPSTITVNYEVKRTLTAVGPANVWVGLKTSGDDGLRVDLRAEVLVNNIVAGTGDLNNVNAGGSGFDKALLQTVALSLTSGSVDVPAGAQLSVRVAARRTCSSSGRNSGTVREWYNGQPVDTGAAGDAGSRIRITLGGTTSDYFLRNAFALSTSAGSSRQSVDADVNGQTACPARPFVPFGIWSVNLP